MYVRGLPDVTTLILKVVRVGKSKRENVKSVCRSIRTNIPWGFGPIYRKWAIPTSENRTPVSYACFFMKGNS